MDTTSIYRMLHNVYVFLDSSDHQALAPFDLTTTQYRLLTLINEDTHQSLSLLSERILRNRSTVSRLIEQLEQRGLVRRIHSTQDRRQQYVELTDSGKKLYAQAQAAHLRSLSHSFEIFSEAERHLLQKHLSRLYEHLLAILADTEV